MNQTWDPAFRYFVLTILFILAIVVLWTVRTALQPLLIAALTAYFLSPAVAFFNVRMGLPRKLAANLVFFLVLALIIALPFTILPGQLGAIQGIVRDLNASLDNIQLMLDAPISVGNLNVDLSALLPSLRASLGGPIEPQPADALRILEIASRNLLWTLVILVTTYFLMTDWERMRMWLIRIAPPAERPDLHKLYHKIRKIWLGYLGGQIRLIVVLAFLYAISWSLIGLPGAFIIGALAGLLNLLPEIGPAMAALVAVVVALLEGSSVLPVSNLWFAAITLGTYLVLNNIKTIWLQPRILGQSVLLHEGIVFVAIVISIMLGGALAVLVVVPVLASFGVIAKYLRRRLLGEPPFPPPAAEILSGPAPLPEPVAPVEPLPERPVDAPGKNPTR